MDFRGVMAIFFRTHFIFVHPVDIVSVADLLVLVTLLLVLAALLLVGCLAFVLPESGGGSG